MMPLVIGLDFDGTMSPTGHDYDMADLKSLLQILETIGRTGPGLRAVQALQCEVDEELMVKLKFQVRRRPLSWVETYRRLASCQRLPYDRRVARRIYRAAAEHIRRGPFELYDDVKETLEVLCAAGHELHIISIGEDVHQRHKIRATRVEDFFDSSRIHIVESDKREVMRRIFGGREDRSVMVGDSRLADIAAAPPGVITVWARYGNPAKVHDSDRIVPDFSIERFTELREIEVKINGRHSR